MRLSDGADDGLMHLHAYPAHSAVCLQSQAAAANRDVGQKWQQPLCVAAGMLFQPVPWSVNTKRGCPPQYEQFLDSPSHVVINVPPNFMFQSKIFKPSRLCTIYKHVRERLPPEVCESNAYSCVVAQMASTIACLQG